MQRTMSGTVRKEQGVRMDWGINEYKINITQQTKQTPTHPKRQNHTASARIKQERIRERRRKRRRQQLFLLFQIIFLAAVIGLGIVVVAKSGELKKAAAWITGVSKTADTKDEEKNLGEDGLVDSMTNYATECGIWNVEVPVKRETWEAVEKLGDYAEKSEVIRAILENTSPYPDEMLEALANNPEMADFVAGYPSSDGSVTGGLTEQECKETYPLFLQWDPRWGYASYGDESNIGMAGCGPTSLSMALFYLTRDETITPDKIAAYSMENGYYMPGTGTAWILMEDVPEKYGIAVENPGISKEIMQRELENGKVLICAMRPGDFTTSGHFIVIYGYDSEGFLVNDPNCVARSKRSWPYETIESQIKQLWSLGNDAGL